MHEDQCAAGVRYADVRTVVSDAEQAHYGFPFRAIWPCSEPAAAMVGCRCPSMRWRTPEEAAVEDAAMKRAVEAALSGRSPCCDAELIERRGKGTKLSFCAKCEKLVMRECRVREPGERRGR